MHQLAVKCSVSNCHYWQNGDCHASQILVTSDQVGSGQPDSYDAPSASASQQTPVSDCMSTCCKTFVPSQSNKKHADDVMKR